MKLSLPPALKIKMPSLPSLKAFSNPATSQGVLMLSFTEDELRLVLVASPLPARKEVIQLLSLDIREQPDEAIAVKLQEALTKIKLKNPRVIGVVPSQWVITRNIEIPSRDPKEIREIINLQASRHTPFARSEIIVDYVNLGVFKSIYTKVLLVIAPRNLVKRYYDLAEKAKLKTTQICFAPEALVRLLTKRLHWDSEKSPACFVHLDRAGSDFLVILRGLVLFLRNIPIGTRDFALEKEAALARFGDELKKSLEAYQNENVEQKPASVLLAGAVAGIENLETSVQNALGLPVKSWAYDKELLIRKDAWPEGFDGTSSFLSAIAPALLPEELAIDLAPEESKLRKSVEERGKEVVKMGILAIVSLGLVCAVLLSHLYFWKARINLLTGRYGPIKKEAQSLEESYAKTQAIKEYLRGRGKAIGTLAALHDLVFPDIYLNEVKFEEEKFSVKGTSVSRPTIFEFVTDLEESIYFKNVQTKYIVGRSEEGKEFSDFEITAVLE